MKLGCHTSYLVNSHIFIVKRGRQLGKKTKNKKKRNKTKDKKQKKGHLNYVGSIK